MDYSIQGMPGAFNHPWLDKTRIVSWTGAQIILLSIGFLAALLVSFSAGAWIGQHLKGYMHMGTPSDTLVIPVQPAERILNPEDTGPDPGALEQAHAPSAVTVSYTIEKHDNLYDVLHSFGVTPDTVREWSRLCRPYYDLARVRPGQSLDLAIDDNDQPILFVFHISSSRYLVVEDTKEGYSARVETEKPDLPSQDSPQKSLVSVPFRYDRSGQIQFKDPQTGKWTYASRLKVNAPSRSRGAEKFYAGRVSDSFYNAAKRSGMSPSQIMELIDIFACEVAFRSQIRKGDSFKVLMGCPAENTGQQNKQIVLAAMIETGEKTHWAFYHHDGRSSGYYDEKGQSLKGFHLIVPVRYTRISSGYTSRRFHPILKIYRPHYGVDYAAPYGTPVRAAASGRVVHAAWKGGYGRYINIRHNSKYATSYGHLSRYARGIRKGKWVRQGQVIGYVGSSGLSTGPHLDYQVFRYGRRINPLRFHGEKGGRIENINAFQVTKARLMREMQRIESASASSIYTSSAAGS